MSWCMITFYERKENGSVSNFWSPVYVKLWPPNTNLQFFLKNLELQRYKEVVKTVSLTVLPSVTIDMMHKQDSCIRGYRG